MTTVLKSKTAADWVKAVRQGLQQKGRSLTNHPTILKLEKGDLTLRQLRVFAGQHLLLNANGERWLGAQASACDDEEVRKKVWEAVLEEMTGHYTKTANHIELQRRFCEAIGISRAEQDRIRPLPSTLVFTQYMEFLIRCRPWYYCMAGIALALESQVPETYKRILPALHTHYGLTPEQTLFYSVHIKADEGHSDTSTELLARFITDPKEMGELEVVAYHAAKLFCDVWSTALEV